MNHLKNSTHKLTAHFIVFSLLLLTAPAWADTSYTFPRILEGSATLLTVDGDREEVVEQQPILVGDRLWVPDGTRLELVLADRSLLRIEGDSEVEFNSIAYSADTEDRATTLRLRRGSFQLVVPEDVLGESLAQLDTPDATVYIHREGTFRITVDARFTELVVRDGLAELVTDRNSILLHPKEAGWAEGYRDRLEVRRARYRDGLERWGDRLTEEARLAYSPYLDESLRYHAPSFANHGTWFEIDGRYAWRPRVDASWRPYSRGSWRRTPAGLTWVSYDSWGYATHHYGDWDYDEYNGWVWYPGRVYSPARVHWYWGPSYVGWCPSGYYSNYYRRHHGGFGLRVGTYGWAGGSWAAFSHWNFSLTLDFGRRYHRDDHRRYIHSGRYLAENNHRLDRGIISNDHRVRGDRADEIFAELREEVENRPGRGDRPQDVNDFVARQPLGKPLAAAVLQTSKPTRPVVAGGKPVNTPATSAKPGRPTIPELRGESGSRRPTMTEVRGENTTIHRRPVKPGAVEEKPRPRPTTRLPSRVTDEEKPTRQPLNSVEKPILQNRPTGRYDEDDRGAAAKPTNRLPTTRPTTTRPTTTRPTTTRPTTTRTPETRPTKRPTTLDRRPTTRPPATRPTTRLPTTRPADRAPSTRPTTRRPTAARPPIDQKPTTRPSDRRPTSRPTLERPSSRPTAQRPTTRPTTRRPTARPTTRRPTPPPTTRRPTARPTTRAEPKVNRSQKDRSRKDHGNRSSARSGGSRKKSEAKANSNRSKSRRTPAKKRDRRDDNR